MEEFLGGVIGWIVQAYSSVAAELDGLSLGDWFLAWVVFCFYLKLDSIRSELSTINSILRHRSGMP